MARLDRSLSQRTEALALQLESCRCPQGRLDAWGHWKEESGMEPELEPGVVGDDVHPPARRSDRTDGAVGGAIKQLSDERTKCRQRRTLLRLES